MATSNSTPIYTTLTDVTNRCTPHFTLPREWELVLFQIATIPHQEVPKTLHGLCSFGLIAAAA